MSGGGLGWGGLFLPYWSDSLGSVPSRGTRRVSSTPDRGVQPGQDVLQAEGQRGREGQARGRSSVLGALTRP